MITQGSPLDSLDPRRLGEELKRARKQQRMTQEEAAKHINVARTTLIAIENGDRRIRAEELVELARLYGRPLSEFLRPRPAMQPFRVVLFRGPAEFKEQHEELVQLSIGRFEDMCRNMLELQHMSGQAIEHEYPPVYIRKSKNMEYEAEGLAQRERSRLRLGDGPLNSPVRDILEQDAGINVFYLPLEPSTISGIYYFAENLGGCVAVNDKHPEDRCRFTMCHDYCHFLVDRYEPAVSVTSGYLRQPASERFANQFANYLLMPTPDVIKRFHDNGGQPGKISLRGLCTMARRYGVSAEAMCHRLEELRLLRAGAWERIIESGTKIEAIEQQLNLAPIPGRRDPYPVRYRMLAFEAWETGKLSEEQFASFMQLDRMAARKVLAEHHSNPSENGQKTDAA